MHIESTTDRIFQWITLRWIYILSSMYVLFIIQGTLVPFDFVIPQQFEYTPTMFIVTTGMSYWADIVANMFLYVPIGVLVHLSIHKKVRYHAIALCASLGIALILSVTTEWIQAFSPTRVSSLVDIVCNMIGTLLGTIISVVMSLNAARFKSFLLLECSIYPRESVLKAYCLGLVIMAASPFSFKIDGAQIYNSIKNAKAMPFNASVVHEQNAQKALMNHDMGMFVQQRQMKYDLWLRWSLELISFAALAWLIEPVLRANYGFSRTHTNALAWWISCGIAFILSALQLSVRSRGFDITDILMRLTGVSVGIVTRWSFIEVHRHASTSQDLIHRSQTWLRRGCIASIVYIVLNGTVPFIHDSRPGRLREAVTSDMMLPGFAYFHARFDTAMDDLIQKIIAYMVFAILLAAVSHSILRTSLSQRMRVCIISGLCLSSIIEIAQIWIRGRIPSLTDPIIACVACGWATFIHHGIVVWINEVRMSQRNATARINVIPTPQSQPISPASLTKQPEWTVTDALIAGLMDVNPIAPHEPAPIKSAPYDHSTNEPKPREPSSNTSDTQSSDDTISDI